MADITQLCKALDFHPDMVSNDCEKIIRMRYGFDTDHHTKLTEIFREYTLARWIRGDEPMTMFINDNETMRPETIASYLVAHFVRALQTKVSEPDGQKWLIAAYFCGEHYSDQTASNNSALGMARSIMLQVLRAMSLDTATFRSCTEGLDQDSISSVCSVLGRLVDWLEEDTRLYIMVDGIALFGQPEERRAGTLEFLNHVKALKKRTRPGGSELKLLITSPCPTKWLDGFLSDDAMRDWMPADGTMPPDLVWTDAHMDELIAEFISKPE